MGGGGRSEGKPTLGQRAHPRWVGAFLMARHPWTDGGRTREAPQTRTPHALHPPRPLALHTPHTPLDRDSLEQEAKSCKATPRQWPRQKEPRPPSTPPGGGPPRETVPPVGQWGDTATPPLIGRHQRQCWGPTEKDREKSIGNRPSWRRLQRQWENCTPRELPDTWGPAEKHAVWGTDSSCPPLTTRCVTGADEHGEGTPLAIATHLGDDGILPGRSHTDP